MDNLEKEIGKFQEKMVELCNKNKVVLFAFMGAITKPVDKKQSQVNVFFTVAPLGKHSLIINSIPNDKKEEYLQQFKKLIELE
jgi:hypothetical protein